MCEGVGLGSEKLVGCCRWMLMKLSTMKKVFASKEKLESLVQ